MLVKDPVRAPNKKLEQAVERKIARRTWGRVGQLRVEIEHGRLVVHGYALSYYAIQLALAAVREVYPSGAVDLDIQIISAGPPARRIVPPSFSGSRRGLQDMTAHM